MLRERLGVVSVKDGCAPQGQCGCCTVLVDGEPRVACVTPATRVVGRVGDDRRRSRRRPCATGSRRASSRPAVRSAVSARPGSSCAPPRPRAQGKTRRVDLDRALAAHLCRCTGWQTVYAAIEGEPTAGAARRGRSTRRRDAPSWRVACRSASDRGFPGVTGASPTTAHPVTRWSRSRDRPARPPATVAAAGIDWVVADSLLEARALAGTVQGRRTTVDPVPPLVPPADPAGGVRLATGWVEPAYLEPDASWCEPGGVPATPLANGGAFGGKVTSPVADAARELADDDGAPGARAVFARRRRASRTEATAHCRGRVLGSRHGAHPRRRRR